MIVCNVKVVASSYESHTQLPPDSAGSLSSVESFSAFQLIVLVFPTCSVTVLVHSHSSDQLKTTSKQLDECCGTIWIPLVHFYVEHCVHHVLPGAACKFQQGSVVSVRAGRCALTGNDNCTILPLLLLCQIATGQH